MEKIGEIGKCKIGEVKIVDILDRVSRDGILEPDNFIKDVFRNKVVCELSRIVKVWRCGVGRVCRNGR
jgi:hypothetical protein